ncbi:MAG: carbohydrate binding family 9 domain-containing protein [Blastocatellia bacterium]|nr:carbohydrate binding family 9 domain-containing protein [Blastocatellia bacterium]
MEKAAVFKDFIQIQPGDNIAPSKETIGYVGYDEKYFYVGIKAFDEPDKIRATVAKRDDIFADDRVRFTLDTFNDQRRAYVFFFNPFGIQADSVLVDGANGPDYSIDVVMESKGVLLEDGYSVEVKVPFKSLRYVAGKGKSWGFNIGRNIARFNDENNSWMPIERGVSSLRQIGKITGLNEIRTERTIEIVPSATVSETGERIEDTRQPLGSRILNNPIKQDIGVSVKFQITPNVTLDAAVNPDFAEVEADAPVVRANERFPIFFPEKRPFFLEGIDYFRTPLQVVNTRNIADPDVAVKLTGKTGVNTFGLFTAVDRFPNTDTKAYIGVMRLKRDFGVQSNIGLIATTYHSAHEDTIIYSALMQSFNSIRRRFSIFRWSALIPDAIFTIRILMILNTVLETALLIKQIWITRAKIAVGESA